jgi:serine/threonine protein phosphatase PrpC
MLNITAVGKSHPGKRRENNEDSLLVLPECRLFVVADGMGGHAAGEVASGIVISVLEEVCRGAFGACGKDDPKPEPDQVLNTALTTANRKVFQQGLENPAQRGMGSTATVMLIGDDDCYTLGHVGDSRIYRYFDGEITQLTTDHSLVQEQQDLGLLNEEDAATHRLKNVITRSIGGREEVVVDTVRGRCGEGDIFLLCSDGFSNEVTPGEMADILSGPGSLEEKAEQCIDLANEKDGTDNITVVLVSAGEGSVAPESRDDGETAGESDVDEAAKTVISSSPAVEAGPGESEPPRKKRGRFLAILFFFALILISAAWFIFLR